MKDDFAEEEEVQSFGYKRFDWETSRTRPHSLEDPHQPFR